MRTKKIILTGLGAVCFIVTLLCIAEILVTTVCSRIFFDAYGLALIGGIMCVSASAGMLFFEKVIANEKRNKALRKIVFYTVFVTYLVMVVTAVLGTAVFMRYSSTRTLSERIRTGMHTGNFVPFHTIMGYIRSYAAGNVFLNTVVINLVGNLVFFMPMGIFLPVITRRRWYIACPVMLVFLFLIESLQLVTGRGSFDIDDIILNFAGFLIVYLITNIKAVKKLIKI